MEIIDRRNQEMDRCPSPITQPLRCNMYTVQRPNVGRRVGRKRCTAEKFTTRHSSTTTKQPNNLGGLFQCAVNVEDVTERISSCSLDPPDLSRTVNAPTGLETQQGYLETLAKNSSEICDHDRRGNDYRIINRQLDASFTYHHLNDLLADVFSEAEGDFHLNIAFGFILHNEASQEYKYFFDSRHHHLFEQPRHIANRHDLVQFTSEVAGFDLTAKYHLDNNYTPSCWRLAGFTNVQVKVVYPKVAVSSHTSPTQSNLQMDFVRSAENKALLDYQENYLFVCLYTREMVDRAHSLSTSQMISPSGSSWNLVHDMN